MDKKSVLSVKNLNKVYSSKNSNNTHALKNLNLEVKEGEIFGLLGPNGAGKTTFINILAGTVRKTAGEVIVWGFDLDKNPRQVRASIGIVPQEVNLDPFFSPKNLLELHAGLYGIKKKDRITDSILKLVSLERQANSYARSLSGGMRRRLLVAKALVHQPPIIFLDEPTAGVDVNLRKNLWDNVKSLNNQGVTIILTTHYLEEAEKMCDRIGILSNGNLVALDSTRNLLDRIKTKKAVFKTNKKINLKDNILDTLKILSNNENEISISYDKNKVTIEEIINLIKKNNAQIIDISTDDGDLEDVFFRLTKN
jgi:ABC-2 type transport system ATP-binding protein